MEVFFRVLVHTACFGSIFGEAVCACVYLWIKLLAVFSFYRLYLCNGRVKFKIREKNYIFPKKIKVESVNCSQ